MIIVIIRYMAAEVSNQKQGVRERATLVSGSPGSHWDLEPAPREDFGSREWEEHAVSMEKERRNYFMGKDVKGFK